MAFLGFGKKKKVLDLTKGYKEKLADEKAMQEARDSSSSGTAGFSVFDSPAYSNSSTEAEDSGTPEEKKKKLAKRIMEMTERLEDLSNQIYHLQQRLEVLERKTNVRVE